MAGIWSKNNWSKGNAETVHDAITATATSDEIDVTGFNALLVSVLITGTGVWTVDIQGRLDTGGTAMDIYDNNDNQLTTGSISESRLKLFYPVPDLVKVVATEDTDGAACTVRVQPINY